MKTVNRIDDKRVALVAGVVAATLAGLIVGSTVTMPADVLGIEPNEPLVNVAIPAARLLSGAAAVAAVGLGVLLLLLREGTGRQAEGARRVALSAAVSCAVAWLILLCLQLWTRAAELSRDGFGLGTSEFLRYANVIPLGRALSFTALCAVAFGVTSLLALRVPHRVPAAFTLVPAVVGTLPMVLSGHPATAANHEIAVVSMGLHVVAASVWVGGLGAVLLFIAARRALLAEVLPCFARIATICLITVALSGLATAGIRLSGRPDLDLAMALITTGYGQLVLAKALCLLSLALLGGYLRDRMVPAIARHQQVPLMLWAGSELTIMGLAFGMATAMGNAQIS